MNVLFTVAEQIVTLRSWGTQPSHVLLGVDIVSILEFQSKTYLEEYGGKIQEGDLLYGVPVVIDHNNPRTLSVIPIDLEVINVYPDRNVNVPHPHA